MSLLLEYKGTEVPIFTVEPDWSSPPVLRMIDRTIVREALNTSEERYQTRPRPLYGLSYRPLTMTEQETGYMRRLLELPDGLPFAMPMWQDRVKLTVAANAGASVLTVETTDDSLWDTFDELALIWTAFNSWELISVSGVSGTTLTLDVALTASWGVGTALLPTWVIPVAFGTLKRNDTTNITSDHSRIPVEFEERFLSVTSTPSASTADTACCQTTGPYFTPAYSVDVDRVGIGNAGPRTSSYTNALAKLLSPGTDCTSVKTFTGTRITGGGTYVSSNQMFYFGCQGGSGGPSGTELCVVMDPAGVAVSYISGFPNPSGSARGLNAKWINTASKVWMQLKGCGDDNAFAIIDPTDNSFVLVSDPILATCLDNQWVYCDIDGCIYCVCSGGVLAKIEVITLEVTEIDLSTLGAVTIRTDAITYTDATPAFDGSGKIWLAYSDTGVIPNRYGIAILDVSGVTAVVSHGLTTDAVKTQLWYSISFDLVFASGDDAGTFDTYTSAFGKTTHSGYALIGAQGTYVDSLDKVALPLYWHGKYCLVYLSSDISGLSFSGVFRILQTGSLRLTQAGGRRLLQAS